jgi:hypothetical protein
MISRGGEERRRTGKVAGALKTQAGGSAVVRAEPKMTSGNELVESMRQEASTEVVRDAARYYSHNDPWVGEWHSMRRCCVSSGFWSRCAGGCRATGWPEGIA